MPQTNRDQARDIQIGFDGTDGICSTSVFPSEDLLRREILELSLVVDSGVLSAAIARASLLFGGMVRLRRARRGNMQDEGYGRDAIETRNLEISRELTEPASLILNILVGNG